MSCHIQDYLCPSTVDSGCSPDYCQPLKICSSDKIPQESLCNFSCNTIKFKSSNTSKFKSKPDSGGSTAELLRHLILCSLFYPVCALLMLTEGLLLM